MEISRNIYDKLVEITRRFKPNEASAFLFSKNSLVIEAPTEDRSPVHFGEIDPEYTQALIDKYGIPSALFHSHPGGNSPSHTDEMYMRATMSIWKCPWLIMSSSMDLKAYFMCSSDTYNSGRLVYRQEKVEIID